MLFDVREPVEWRLGHIADAVHVPLGELRPESVPRERVVVAVWGSGDRSHNAANQLAAVGVRDMAGGMKAWAATGLPIFTDDGASGTVG